MEKDESGVLLTTQEAAIKLKIKPSTLAVWRSTKRYGLSYVKCGRLVRYRMSDIETFIRERLKNGLPPDETE